MIIALMRSALQDGLRALESQLSGIAARLHSSSLTPAERQCLQQVVKQLAQRINAWQEWSLDEPALAVPLEALARRVHELRRGLAP